MEDFDLVSALQVLPETDPIEVDGIQFGMTCNSECVVLTVNIFRTVIIQTVCIGGTC